MVEHKTKITNEVSYTQNKNTERFIGDKRMCNCFEKCTAPYSGKRYRNYRFTYNHYNKDPNWKEAMLGVWNRTETEADMLIKYMCYAEEIGEKCGTPHLQGFLSFKDPQYIMSLVKLLPVMEIKEIINDEIVISDLSWHVMHCNASEDDNRKYCEGLVKKKGDVLNPTFVQWGERPGMGARTDITALVNLAKSGVSYDAIMEEHCITNYQQIQVLKEHCTLKLNGAPRNLIERQYVVYAYGKTDVYKTSKLWEEFKGAYDTNVNARWFGGYVGQETIFIDDFRVNFCEYNVLLKILQNKPFRAEVKHGFVQLKHTTSVISSCLPPTELEFKLDKGDDRDQFYRRISEIRYYYDKEQPPKILVLHDITDSDKRCNMLEDFCEQNPIVQRKRVRYYKPKEVEEIDEEEPSSIREKKKVPFNIFKKSKKNLQ